MNQPKSSKRPPASSNEGGAPSKVQKTSDKKKCVTDMNAQIQAAVIAAACKGALSTKKEKPKVAPKKAKTTPKLTVPKSKPAVKSTASTKATPSKSTATSKVTSSSSKPTSTGKVTPSAASKSTPTSKTATTKSTSKPASSPATSKPTPTNKVTSSSVSAKSKEGAGAASATKTAVSDSKTSLQRTESRSHWKPQAPLTETVYAPSQQYPQIDFYNDTSRLMWKLKRKTSCYLSLREEGPKVFMVITADTRTKLPQEVQIKEAKAAIDEFWGEDGCEQLMAEKTPRGARRNERYSSKRSQGSSEEPAKIETEPLMDAFTLSANVSLDNLNRTAKQDFQRSANFEDDYIKKKLIELPSEEPKWNDLKLWDKVDLVLKVLEAKPPKLSFGQKLQRVGFPLFACKISWGDANWYGVGDSMEKSRINAYQQLWRTLEPMTLRETKTDAFRKPFTDESNRKSFQDESFRSSFQDEPFRKTVKDDSFRKPFKDDSFRKPFKDDSFRKPFKDDSFRKPFKDDSFRKSFKDDSFRKPFKDDSFREPFKDDTFREPFKDDSFREPFKDDSFREPFKDDSFREPFKDDSFRKPFKDDSFRKPFKDESFRKPFRDDSFRKPFKDDSFRKPFKDDSFWKPFNDDSMRKPFQDDSFRKSYTDDSFRKSYTDDSLTKPFRDDSFRKSYTDDSSTKPFRGDSFRKSYTDDSSAKPFRDDSFRKSYTDDSSTKPFRDDSFRKSYTDDSSTKPFRDDSFRKSYTDDSSTKPFRGDSFKKPFKDESFRKSSSESFSKEWSSDVTSKTPQEEELERLVDCVEQIRLELEEARELRDKIGMQADQFGKFKGERDLSIDEKIKKLQNEEEHLKIKLERALNESNEVDNKQGRFSRSTRFQDRFQSNKMSGKSDSQSSRNFQQKFNRKDDWQCDKGGKGTINKNESWVEKRQKPDWENNEGFQTKNIPIWNDMESGFSQQQSFQKPARGRDFQMRGDRAGGRGRGRYDGQRHNVEMNEFGGQKKQWGYESLQGENKFDSSKNEMGYRDQQKEWGYESQNIEKKFDNQKKDFGYETQRNKPGYLSQKNEAKFDGQKNVVGYVSQKNTGYFSQKKFGGYDQKSDQRNEGQKDDGQFEREYQSRNAGESRVWDNERDSQRFGNRGGNQDYRTREEDSQDRKSYADNKSQVIRRSRSPIASRNIQTWQSNPSSFESTGRFRTSHVKRDESRDLFSRPNQSWGQLQRDPSGEETVPSSMQETKSTKSPNKMKGIDPRLETYGNVMNSMHQTELVNLKNKVNEQLNEIKDCLREGTLLVEEQRQEAMRMVQEKDRRNMYLKLNNLEESVNDLRSKEEQTLKKFKEKVKQLEMKYQLERNSKGWQQDGAQKPSYGYSTATQEPKGYFSSSYQSSGAPEVGSRYSTAGAKNTDSFQQNMGGYQQQKGDSFYGALGNRSFQGGTASASTYNSPSFTGTSTYDSTSFTGAPGYSSSAFNRGSNYNKSDTETPSVWSKPDTSFGMQSSGSFQSSDFQQNKMQFDTFQKQYGTTSTADTHSMQGGDFDSRNKFSQSYGSGTQDEQHQSMWSTEGNSSNLGSGNAFASKGYTSGGNRGYFSQSTQSAGNVQQW